MVTTVGSFKTADVGELSTPEDNFILDADELANQAARALELILGSQGRTTSPRLVEAVGDLMTGLRDYLHSRSQFRETEAGKFLLPDRVGDADNSEPIPLPRAER